MDYYTPTYPRGKGKIAQSLFLTLGISLTIGLAFLGFWFITTIIKTDIESLQDIRSNFGLKQNFSNVEQKQDNDNGRISTTITGNITAKNSTSINESLDYLTNTINNVNETETVNLDLTILKEDTNIVHVKYLAESFADYKDGKFEETRSLINELTETDKNVSYDLTIRPTNSGKYVTLRSTTEDLDSLNENDYRLSFNETVDYLWKNYTLEYGDIFNVTYSNLDEGEKNITPVTINAIIDSELNYNKATQIPTSIYKKIDTFVNNRYKTFYPSLTQVDEIVYTTYPEVHSDRLTIVTPIEDGAVLAKVEEEMKSGVGIEKIYVPSSFDIVFRKTVDAPNTYTIWDYFN